MAPGCLSAASDLLPGVPAEKEVKKDLPEP
jgi:hypothetical protein